MSVIQNGITSLFSVNLQTGLATLIGVYGPAGIYQGLAYSRIAFAEMTGLNANQLAVARTPDNFTSGGMDGGYNIHATQAGITVRF